MTRSNPGVMWQARLMRTTYTRVSSAVLLLFMAGGAAPVAKDRIFVDQWSPTRSQLFIADADGTNPRTLVAGFERDYNASISFDGQWVVFTSERNGSADIFRVRPDGIGLEQLTDDPAYDDQAALSPDGSLLAFVSTRDAGSTDIYVLDLHTRRVRNLTNSPGGDFRPSWSPDGQTLAFSSDLGTKFQKAAGRWEHVHPASVYLLGVDGQGLRKLSPEGQFAGSPEWSPDGTRVVFYELAVADTFRARQLGQQPRLESRIVSVDVATGARVEHASGPGLKVSPQFLGPDRIGYLAKSGLPPRWSSVPARPAASGTSGAPLGRTTARAWCITVARSRRWQSSDHRARCCWVVIRSSSSSMRVAFRPCRPTDDSWSSANGPGGEAATIAPSWSCGMRTGRIHDASSEPKARRWRRNGHPTVTGSRSALAISSWAHPSGAGRACEARRFGNEDTHHRAG